MQIKTHVASAALALVLATAAAAADTPAPAEDAPAPATDEPPKHEFSIPLSKDPFGSLLVGGNGFLDTDKLRAHLEGLQQRYSRSGADADANGNGNDKRGTVTEPLASTAQLWTGPVRVGTPPQTLNVAFNTGAADFVANPGAYKPAASKSAKDTGSKFDSAYGATHNSAGSIYYDTAVIAGTTVKKIAIGRSTSDFIGDGADALGGLSLPELSCFPQQMPIWKALSEQGNVKPIFNMRLAQSGSALTFGAAGPSPTYVGVTKAKNNGWWMVPGSLGGVSQQVILDTTTSYIIAPPAVAKKMFQSLKVKVEQDSSGILYGTFKCSSPPKVTFQFGGKTLNLPPSVVSMARMSDGSCALPIVGQDMGFDATIGGDAIFRSTRAITFDHPGLRVGFS